MQIIRIETGSNDRHRRRGWRWRGSDRLGRRGGGWGGTAKLLVAVLLATASTGCGRTTGCVRTGTLGGGGGSGLASVTGVSIIGSRRTLILGGKEISSFLTEMNSKP
jgi:hypothetical protein